MSLLTNQQRSNYNLLVDKSTRGERMENRFKLFTILNSRINRCIRKIKTEEMSEFNLKSTHVSCLYYLHEQKLIKIKILCLKVSLAHI